MPQGPVYVNLDAEMQEAKLPEPLPPIDASRFCRAVAQRAGPRWCDEAAELLRQAKRP